MRLEDVSNRGLALGGPADDCAPADRPHRLSGTTVTHRQKKNLGEGRKGEMMTEGASNSAARQLPARRAFDSATGMPLADFELTEHHAMREHWYLHFSHMARSASPAPTRNALDLRDDAATKMKGRHSKYGEMLVARGGVVEHSPPSATKSSSTAAHLGTAP